MRSLFLSVVALTMFSLIQVSKPFAIGFCRRPPLQPLQTRLYLSKQDFSQAESLVTLLANRGRSWRRLRRLVELSLRERPSYGRVCQSVADIGTDHGLLALGLASTGRFDRVTGVDVSLEALENGALRLEKELSSKLKDGGTNDNPEKLVDFRHGDGLAVLEPGEADIVCIAGMGVFQMMKILECKAKDADELMLDELNCQRLVLQPQSPGPKHVSLLYQFLHDIGWEPHQEEIDYLRGRFYFTASFARRIEGSKQSVALPCASLMEQGKDSPSHSTLVQYVDHHFKWLRYEYKEISEIEEQWLANFESFRNKYRQN